MTDYEVDGRVVVPGCGIHLSRRQFLGGAAGLSAAAVLAACGSNNTATSSNGTQDLSMWVWEEVSQWKQVIKRGGLHKAFPKVDLTFTSLNSTTLAQKAISALASGVQSGLPSIVRIGMGTYRAMVNTKGLEETTSILTPRRGDILPTTWQSLNVGGKTYALPDDTGYSLFGYRRDLFDKAGIGSTPDEVGQAVSTYDDLITVGKKLKAKTGALLLLATYGAEGLGSTSPYTTMVQQGSTGFFDLDGNVIADSAYHQQCAEEYLRIYKAGLTVNITGVPQQWAAYKDGHIAALPYPNWQDFEFVAYTPSLAYKWQVTSLPKLTADSKGLATADGCAIVVPNGQGKSSLDLALKVGTFMKLNKTASEAHMRVFSGAFESNVPALEAMRGTKSPMLYDQKVYDIWLAAVKKENPYPISYASIFGSQMGTAVSNAIYNILEHGAPIAKTLKGAADSVRKLQDTKGQK